MRPLYALHDVAQPFDLKQDLSLTERADECIAKNRILPFGVSFRGWAG